MISWQHLGGSLDEGTLKQVKTTSLLLHCEDNPIGAEIHPFHLLLDASIPLLAELLQSTHVALEYNPSDLLPPLFIINVAEHVGLKSVGGRRFDGLQQRHALLSKEQLVLLPNSNTCFNNCDCCLNNNAPTAALATMLHLRKTHATAPAPRHELREQKPVLLLLLLE